MGINYHRKFFVKGDQLLEKKKKKSLNSINETQILVMAVHYFHPLNLQIILLIIFAN